MAEEKIFMQYSPEITKLDKTNPRRNSTDIVKKSSAGKSSSQNYLRASTGSCHDFCKYGREHSFAVHAKNPKPKRMTPSPGKQKHTECEVVGQTSKPSAAKHKTSDTKLQSLKRMTPSPGTQKHTECEVVGQTSKPSAAKHKPSITKLQSSKQNLGNSVEGERNKTSKVQLKPSPDIAHSPGTPEIINREIVLPSNQLKVSPTRSSSNTKIKKDSEMKTTPSSKYSPGPEFKSLTRKPSSSSTVSVSLNGTRKTSSKPGKVTGTSKTTVNKLPAAPSASLSPKTSGSRVVNLYARKHSSVKLVSPLKDQKRTQKAKLKPDTEKVQETTLHVVEADRDDKVIEPVQGDSIVQISSSLSLQLLSLSHPDSQFSSPCEDVAEKSEYIDKDPQQSECSHSEDLEESEYTESEADGFISEDDETINISEVDKLKGDNNQSLNVGRVIRSGNKDGALVRLKFRKGRTVDLQSVHNVPRKLRFRRGKILGDNVDRNAARRRSFEKREFGNDSNSAGPSSEKVALRHQDMQGKKDAQGLYNNVIEETASKLVESRKSKVKALVSAFETVISLQES